MAEETIAFNIFSVPAMAAPRVNSKVRQTANGRQVFHNFGAGRVTSVPDRASNRRGQSVPAGEPAQHGELVRVRTLILSSGVPGRIAKRARGRAPNRYRISD